MKRNHTGVHVEKCGVILEPTDFDFEKQAVLNPGVYQDGETVHVLYRAISQNTYKQMFAGEEDFRSSIGYARLQGPLNVVERSAEPLLVPSSLVEVMGVEDPRLVKIENIFYLTYTAHDGLNAVCAYATSTDLKTFYHGGIISPKMTYDEVGSIIRDAGMKDQYAMFEAYYEEFGDKDILLWEKDAILFPSKINGKYALLHRILPDIHLIYFDDFTQLHSQDFWREYLAQLKDNVVLENRFWFETRDIGGGAPPIETDDGWLFIFHGVEELNGKRTYRASAALLDKSDPRKVIGRLREPLFSPEEPWELSGFVNNVVFPTGTSLFGDNLYIYYGAADRVIAAAKVSLRELLLALKKTGNNF